MYEKSSAFNLISSRKKSSIKENDLIVVNECISKIRKLRPNADSKSADASAVWERKSCGYRIVDLQLDRFMQALRFVLTHFCQTEPLSKAVGLFEDAVSIKAFTNTVLNKMSHMMSFCALREGTGEFVGVLVASILIQHQRPFKSETYHGEALHQIKMLKNYAMAKALFYETLGAEKSVHVDVLCVESGHQKQGVGTALLRSCVARATESATPCVGEFTSGAAQTIGTSLLILDEVKVNRFLHSFVTFDWSLNIRLADTGSILTHLTLLTFLVTYHPHYFKKINILYHNNLNIHSSSLLWESWVKIDSVCYCQAIRRPRVNLPPFSASRLAFKTLSEIPYKILGAEDHRYKVFEACHPENYSIACMALDVTPPELPPSPTPVPASTKKSMGKRSKAKKGRLKNR